MKGGQIKTNIITIVLSTFLLAACNYRVFDLTEYPELQGSIPGGNIGSKITESTFESIFITVVQAKCLSCHKVGGKAEEIPLTSYKEIFEGTTEEFEALIIPGKPEESAFYTAMLPDSRRPMPPKKSMLGAVEAERLEAIKAWIKNGALEREAQAR